MSRNASLREIIGRKTRTIVGLNSGTSADGVDAAVVRISGCGLRSECAFVAGETYPWSAALRHKIRKCAEPDFHDAEAWLTLDVQLAEAFAAAALRIVRRAGKGIMEVDLIGSHGQTIRHSPGTKLGTITHQLGDPARIAVRTGIITVGDFRVADTAAGGQGAPLTPIANVILFGGVSRKVGVLNIGGIANITQIRQTRAGVRVFGSDCGPGNMLVDYLARTLFGREYDRDGETARRGRVHAALVKQALNHSFFRASGPKSTGREMFGDDFAARFLSKCRARGLDNYDILATASAVTIEAVRTCCELNELSFDRLIVAGGGAKNQFFLENLRSVFPKSTIVGSSHHGMPEDYLEAVSFAVLANETLCSNSYDLKDMTGSRKRVVLGKICQP